MENLRFVTAKENLNNPLTVEKLNGNSLAFISTKVLCVETGKTYTTIKECAEELGLFATTISKVCKGKCKSYKGYHFKYAD